MKKSEWVQQWLDTAAEDLRVCESLFEKKHYGWCLFIGHLVLEKTLKALWIDRHYPEPHPRIHNLVRLAEKIPLKLSKEQEDFLLDVNSFHIQGRYPAEKQEFYKLSTREFASKNLEAIKAFRQWLLKQF